MAALRSWPLEAPWARTAVLAPSSAATRMLKIRRTCMVTPCRRRSDVGELLGVCQHVPDGLTRGGYGSGEWRITILKEGDHLYEQHFVFLTQLSERHLGSSLVVGAELREQIVHLVLQGQLGEHPDRMGIAQALLEPREVQ